MVMEAHSRVTFKLFARVATWFFRVRGVLILIGVVAAIWLAMVIAIPATASARALVPLSLILWIAVALGTAYTLPLLPPPIVAADGFWQRTRKRLLAFGYGLAVVAALALGATAVLMTVRAITLSGN
jgi:hypothetical protein